MVVRVTLSLNVLVCALAGLIMNFPVCVTIIASVCTATLLLSAQHQFLAAFASLLLGELGQLDHEALDLDTHFEGFSFWWNVCSVHFAGMPYFMRLLWQFGLRRLSRIPRGRVALWPSLRPSQKVRLSTFTGVVTLVQLLTIAYMVSDDQGNEVAQSMLVMDGTVVLLSFVFELVIQVCAALSNDWQQKEMARPGDIPYCALQLLRSTLGLSLSVASFSLHGGVLSNAPWIVQAYLARRLWLVVSHHRVLLRSRTVLLGVEDSFEEGMCVICLESLNKTEPAKRLACGHAFHSTCLRRWLTEARTCPTCRVVLAYLEGTTPVPPSNHRLVRLEADSDNGPTDDEPVSPRSLSAAASPNRLRQDFFPGMETATSTVATDAPYPVASPVSSQGGGSMHALYQLDSSRAVATWPPEHRQRLFVRLMRQRRRRPRRARDAETQVSDSDFTESQVASPVGMPTGDTEAFEPLIELPPKRNRSEHPSASSAA